MSQSLKEKAPANQESAFTPEQLQRINEGLDAYIDD